MQFWHFLRSFVQEVSAIMFVFSVTHYSENSLTPFWHFYDIYSWFIGDYDFFTFSVILTLTYACDISQQCRYQTQLSYCLRIYWHQSGMSIIFCSQHFYDILFPKYVTSKTCRHDVMTSNTSWQQKVCHDVNNTSLRQKIVMTSKSLS